MNDAIKVDKAKVQSATSGSFSGAAFIKRMNGTDDPGSIVRKKATGPKEADSDKSTNVPYGDERFIEGIVAQLGSE